MDSDDEYTIPLQDQRVFGSGLKRKRVHFVPGSHQTSVQAPSCQEQKGLSARNMYLSVVMPQSSEPDSTHRGGNNHSEQSDQSGGMQDVESEASSNPKICPVCLEPQLATGRDNVHDLTWNHQLCLPHSHGPSAIDRSRKGLSLLRSQGWDPDERLGLGPSGQGILHPVRVRMKVDTAGVGSQIREQETDQRIRRQNLNEQFYSNTDIDRYLQGN